VAEPVILYLEKQYRQDDEQLLSILTAMRDGDLRRRHAEALLARIDATPDTDDMTELHTVNIDVDALNDKKLAALGGDEIFYTQVYL
jgi:hypothetical protein